MPRIWSQLYLLYTYVMLYHPHRKMVTCFCVRFVVAPALRSERAGRWLQGRLEHWSAPPFSRDASEGEALEVGAVAAFNRFAGIVATYSTLTTFEPNLSNHDWQSAQGRHSSGWYVRNCSHQLMLTVFQRPRPKTRSTSRVKPFTK